MSLQVWLPLRGNLNNQGLDGSLEFTNTASATASTDGKIGSCYLFSATSGSGILLSSGKSASEFMNAYINHHSWSMCAWIKTTSNDNVVFGLTYGLRLWCGSTNYLHLYNSTRTVSASNSISTIDGKWHHICATYNIMDNAINIYVDGIKGTTAYYPSGETYASSWTNAVAIGRDFNDSTANAHYYFQGSMNDARIYDHCLSTKEVREIYKALISHYKCDNNGLGGISNICSNSLGEFTGTVPSSSYTDFKVWSNVATVNANEVYTLSYYAKSDIADTVLTNHFYNNASNIVQVSSVVNSDGYTSTRSDGYSLVRLATHYRKYWVTYTFNSTTTSALKTILFRLQSELNSSSLGAKVSVKNVKLEKGSVATQWIPNESEELYYQIGACGSSKLTTNALDKWENISGSAVLQSNGYYKVTYTGGGWWGSRYAVNLEAGKTYVASSTGYGTKTQMWFWRDGTNSKGGNINTTSTPQFLYVKYTPTVSGAYYIVCYTATGNVNYYKDVCFCECNEELDSSGYSNNGVKMGSITSATPSIRYEGCYEFTGDDYIKIPKPMTISNSSYFTVSMWVKPKSGCGSYSTVLSNYSYPASGFWMAINTESSGTWFYNGTYARGNSLISLDTWHHIVMVFNAGVVTWYTDGKATTTSDVSSQNTAFTDYLAIGNSYTGTSWNTDFVGNISDVRIYATALSADDIKELYNTPASIDKSGNIYAYGFREE